MSVLGLLFAGKPHLPPETWEDFTPELPPSEEVDDDIAREWAVLIHFAQNNGVEVQFKQSGIRMSYGKSYGTFKDMRGGLDMARKCVEGWIGC